MLVTSSTRSHKTRLGSRASSPTVAGPASPTAGAPCHPRAQVSQILPEPDFCQSPSRSRKFAPTCDGSGVPDSVTGGCALTVRVFHYCRVSAPSWGPHPYLLSGKHAAFNRQHQLGNFSPDAEYDSHRIRVRRYTRGGLRLLRWQFAVLHHQARGQPITTAGHLRHWPFFVIRVAGRLNEQSFILASRRARGPRHRDRASQGQGVERCRDGARRPLARANRLANSAHDTPDATAPGGLATRATRCAVGWRHKALLRPSRCVGPSGSGLSARYGATCWPVRHPIPDRLRKPRSDAGGAAPLADPGGGAG